MADPEENGCVLVASTLSPWDHGLDVHVSDTTCRWPGPSLTGLQCRRPKHSFDEPHRDARMLATHYAVYEWTTNPETGEVVAPSSDAVSADPYEDGASPADGEAVAAEGP